jgi:hypothetical protein
MTKFEKIVKKEFATQFDFGSKTTISCTFRGCFWILGLVVYLIHIKLIGSL